ncbi:hypothetical protein [Caballeronia sp. NCF4]|uniref:hypothetical protein n=1 Tax=Caballeronia sp. NCF4 TaxID=2921758 RepID=UPI0020294A5B|nr:hypothetical protein [Caballeronia sp. NCF4]
MDHIRFGMQSKFWRAFGWQGAAGPGARETTILQLAGGDCLQKLPNPKLDPQKRLRA